MSNSIQKINTSRIASQAAVAVLSAALIPGAFAGEVKKSKIASVLEEVVVQATKKSSGQSLQDAPVAVSAFSSDDLSIIKANTLQDIGVGLPNVDLSSGGTFKGVANFASRGFSVNATTASVEPAVGTFVDGIYLGNNYGVLTDFLDIESVEVLRGPQGLLFGRNVTGGAVLINNARPSEDFLAKVSARFETGVDQTFSAVINSGLTDTISARLAIRYNDDDGYFKNRAPNTDDFGKMETYVVRPSIAFKPNDFSEYVLMVEHGSMEGDGAAAQSSSLYDNHDVGIENPGLTDIEWTQITSESSWDVAIGDGTITNILGYREVESDTTVDLATAPTQYLGAISYVDHDQLSNELRYNGFFGKFDVTTGLYYFTQDLFALTAGAGGDGSLNTRGGGDLDHESYGIFASVDYIFTDKLTLTAGLRYSDETKDTKVRIRRDDACSYVTQSCPYRPEDSQSADWQSWSPKVGFRWKPSNDITYYGYYAKGYRSGGFNLRQTGAAAGDPLAPGYDEEVQDAYELGMKSTFNEGRTRFNAALFYSEITDLQKDVVIPGTAGGSAFPQVAANTADARSQGVELELNHQLSDEFLLTLSYGFIDAEYTDVLFDISGDGIVDATDKGLDLTRTPRHSGSAALTYEHSFDDGSSMLSRLSWSSRARSYTADNNTIDVPSRDVIDFFSTYYSVNDTWSVSLYGKNLTDERVYDVRAVLPPVLAGGDFSVIGEGRTYGLELNYNFD